MKGVTDHDDEIIMKALAYAIEAIERLPPRWRRTSDQEDMIRLLEAGFQKGWAPHWRTVARAHLEQRGLAGGGQNGSRATRRRCRRVVSGG
jgi:hypothetical protein